MAIRNDTIRAVRYNNTRYVCICINGNRIKKLSYGLIGFKAAILGGGYVKVKALTVEVRVVLRDYMRSRPEVDQLDAVRLVQEVDQNVLVLDIPMNDPELVASQDGLDNLPQEPSSKVFLQRSLFRDEVEEIFAEQGPLHDENVGVWPFVEV